jgi:hypothetical protein
VEQSDLVSGVMPVKLEEDCGRLGKLFAVKQVAFCLFTLEFLSEASCDPYINLVLASHPVKLLGCCL